MARTLQLASACTRVMKLPAWKSADEAITLSQQRVVCEACAGAATATLDTGMQLQ